jgi:hypothetical protein
MENPIVSEEFAHSINGVSGRMFARTVGGRNYKPGTFTSQKWGASREYTSGGSKFRMSVKIRFDDDCRNGHNTFSITCDIDEARGGKWREFGGGAAHEEIARVFPELAPLIKWHLCSTDGPMHYVANAVYLAGDRDHNGKRAGEPWAFEDAVSFGDNPIKHRLKAKFAKFLKEAEPGLNGDRYDFQVIDISEQKTSSTGKIEYYRGFTFGGFGVAWYDCPFKTEADALDFLHALKHCGPIFHRMPTQFSEGKERQLEAARQVAVWPEATDAELCAEPDELKAALAARLPGLIAAFRADVEAAGFMWEPGA